MYQDEFDRPDERQVRMPDLAAERKERAGEKKLPIETVGSSTGLKAFDRKKKCDNKVKNAS
jgi:hypothetical protein